MSACTSPFGTAVCVSSCFGAAARTLRHFSSPSDSHAGRTGGGKELQFFQEHRPTPTTPRPAPSSHSPGTNESTPRFSHLHAPQLHTRGGCGGEAAVRGSAAPLLDARFPRLHHPPSLPAPPPARSSPCGCARRALQNILTLMLLPRVCIQYILPVRLVWRSCEGERKPAQA